jgi:hypothetical protein
MDNGQETSDPNPPIATTHSAPQAAVIASQAEPTTVLTGPPSLWHITTAILICILILALYVALTVGFAYFVGPNAAICFYLMYFRGAVGIPLAIIAAIAVVVLLSAAYRGNFKLSAWGISLEGPSAPITMWCVCFVFIGIALYKLFPEIKTTDALPAAMARFCTGS